MVQHLLFQSTWVHSQYPYGCKQLAVTLIQGVQDPLSASTDLVQTHRQVNTHTHEIELNKSFFFFKFFFKEKGFFK